MAIATLSSYFFDDGATAGFLKSTFIIFSTSGVFKSVRLNTIPVLAGDGWNVTSECSPEWRPIPLIEKEFLMVFCTDVFINCSDS